MITFTSVTTISVAGTSAGAEAVWVPTIAALITVAGGIWTYIRQQREKRRDHLRDLFSQALRAVADYQELPYLVRRRTAEPPMSTSEMIRHISDVQTRLDYYVARIGLESARVAAAYQRLVSSTRREAGSQMTEAWALPRITDDTQIPLGEAYSRDEAENAKEACLEAMQRHVGIKPT